VPRHPVVLLPGILRPGADWRLVEARLRDAGWRTTALDDPAGVDGDWGPRRAADALAPALPPRAHLVGHSRGATIASWIAAQSPDRAASLAVVCSPPEASEAFRAHFRGRDHPALRYLASIPDDEFPAHALRRYRGPALVVEAGDDPLYSPTHTLFWRAYLPYATFHRVEEGGHDFFAREPGASLLADLLLKHLEAAP
jgi:pimeloyl-ACP methyl ester carboxylesterase